ncbi:MAG: hypothetical protein QOI31_2348 [Solirubrobacterales bacterium]|jgi:hypothetical protein|nr:hypothetical protein [Solirubrobacterales bacterium]
MPEILAELRVRPVRSAVILAVTGAWTAWVGATVIDVTVPPMSFAILVGVPIGLIGLVLMSEESEVLSRLCAGWTALLLGATVMAGLILTAPTLALAPVAVVVSAVLCAKFPAGSAVILFALTGFYGSLQAFTSLSGILGADILLGGMWIGLLLSRMAGGRTQTGIVWPAILLLGFYIAVTAVDVLSAESFAPALLSFRLSTWYLLAVILIAFAGWSSNSYTRIARGAIVTGLLVGAYAMVRWFIGPASAEFDYASQVGGAFNFVDGELRTFGSFGSGHQLGFWTGVVAPFCLAAALGWRGRWRAIAAVAFTALVFAVLASQVRGAFLGLVIGSGIVLLLYQFAASTPRLDIGRSVLVGICCLGILSGALLVTAGGEGGLDRYDAIFDPSEDPAYLRREQKLAAALPEIAEHPFGHGLGTASLNYSLRPDFIDIASFSLDNSFLRIAYEQGVIVALLLGASLLALLLRLSTGSVRVQSRDAATIGIGAAGALASTGVLFYSGMYNEDLLALGAWMLIGLGVAFVAREERSTVVAEIAVTPQADDLPSAPRAHGPPKLRRPGAVASGR